MLSSCQVLSTGNLTDSMLPCCQVVNFCQVSCQAVKLAVNCQLSTVNCQLSIALSSCQVSCQLSAVSGQLSIALPSCFQASLKLSWRPYGRRSLLRTLPRDRATPTSQKFARWLRRRAGKFVPSSIPRCRQCRPISGLGHARCQALPCTLRPCWHRTTRGFMS